jgi:DNA-binding response OmpR family regulator
VTGNGTSEGFVVPSLPGDVPPVVTLVQYPDQDHQLIKRLLSGGALLIVVPSVDVARQLLMEAGLVWAGRSRSQRILEFDHLQIDVVAHSAKWRGTALKLTEREFRLLSTLVSEPERAWSFAELATRAWGIPRFRGEAGYVRVAVKRLRAKLVRAGVAGAIQSVRGYGFRLASA